MEVVHPYCRKTLTPFFFIPSTGRPQRNLGIMTPPAGQYDFPRDCYCSNLGALTLLLVPLCLFSPYGTQLNPSTFEPANLMLKIKNMSTQKSKACAPFFDVHPMLQHFSSPKQNKKETEFLTDGENRDGRYTSDPSGRNVSHVMLEIKDGLHFKFSTPEPAV